METCRGLSSQSLYNEKKSGCQILMSRLNPKRKLSLVTIVQKNQTVNIGRPGVGRPHGVFGALVTVLTSCIIFQHCPLIMEFTTLVSKVLLLRLNSGGDTGSRPDTQVNSMIRGTMLRNNITKNNCMGTANTAAL
jgi:hypothetical protein